MKENRTLLIFIGIMLFVGLAITVPDCLACHPIHLIKSAAERRAEALETQDLTNRLRGAALTLAVDYNTLTVDVKEPLVDSNGFRNITREIHDRDAIEGAWAESYSSYHGNISIQGECIHIVWKDESGRLISICRSRDSVERLFENESLCW